MGFRGGWVPYLNREGTLHNSTIKLLDPELLNPKNLNPSSEPGRQLPLLHRFRPDAIREASVSFDNSKHKQEFSVNPRKDRNKLMLSAGQTMIPAGCFCSHAFPGVHASLSWEGLCHDAAEFGVLSNPDCCPGMLTPQTSAWKLWTKERTGAAATQHSISAFG